MDKGEEVHRTWKVVQEALEHPWPRIQVSWAELIRMRLQRGSGTLGRLLKVEDPLDFVFEDSLDMGYSSRNGLFGSCGGRRSDIYLRVRNATYGRFYPECAHFFQSLKAILDLHISNTAREDSDVTRIKPYSRYDEAAACYATVEQAYEALDAADTEQRKAHAVCIKHELLRTLY